MRKKVSLLWTGGWDSTFRLVELSFADVEIFPVYVIDPNRQSKERELTHMQMIVEALRKKPLTKATIFDIEKIRREDIPEDPEITEAYHKINGKTNLGSQHEWLARLGKMRPGMEMGTEAGSPETSHIIHAISEYGLLVMDGETGHLDPERSTREGMLVLGWFRFPIISRTEQDMLRAVREWGYEDVMEKIWFCHAPIHGKPCGMCHPCEVKMESDMAFLLPEKARKRYRAYRFLCACFGKLGGKVANKLLRRN